MLEIIGWLVVVVLACLALFYFLSMVWVANAFGPKQLYLGSIIPLTIGVALMIVAWKFCPFALVLK